MTKKELVALGKVLAGPRRIEIIELLNSSAEAISPNAAAKALRDGLSQVSYHFGVLRECGVVKLAKTEPRRGALEHFYKLDPRSPILKAITALGGLS